MTAKARDPLTGMSDTAWAIAELTGRMTEMWAEVWWAGYNHWAAAAAKQMQSAPCSCENGCPECCEGPLFA